MFRFHFTPRMAALLERGACQAMPNVDISESDDSYSLVMEIPGAMKDDIKVWVENDILIVSGEKKPNLGKDDVRLHSERCFGRFERSFRFPKDVDRNNVKADFENGVLTVTIAKAAEAKPKEISIK